MNKVLLKFTIYIIALIFYTNLSAQNQSVRFNHIDIEQGLSDNMIRDMFQDSKGFMWFATWDGLNRYDGYEFKVYKHIDGDPNSLRVNKITCLLEDHLGRMWVGTFGGGLSLYNRKEENFTNFIHNPNDSNSISTNKIVSIFEDSKNRIWIGTQSIGVSLIDDGFLDSDIEQKKNIKFINFKNDPQNPTSISGGAIMVFFEDSSGTMWCGAYDGSLNKLMQNHNSAKDYKFVSFHPESKMNANIASNSFKFMRADDVHPGLLWLVDYYKGLIWFDTKHEKFIYKYPYLKISENIPTADVQSILIDKDGAYWFGTFGKGIFTINPEHNDDEFEHFDIHPLNPYGIDAPNITNIYQDASGLLWLGTNSNGLYTFQKRTKGFIGYHHNYFNDNSLISNNVLHVQEDNNGNLWIGTEFGLDKYDPVKQQYTHFKHNPLIKESINSDVVYTVIQDSNGTIWVGTDKGLDKYHPSTNSFNHFFHNANDTNSISKGEIINTFIDSKGSLWIGSWNGGLNKLITTPSGKFEKFLQYTSDPNDPTSISNNRIMSFAESKDGTLWIGTSDGGLNKLVSDYNVGKDNSVIKPRFISYQHDPNDLNSISNNDVRTIYIDDEGTLWIGTFGGGLNKFILPDSENDSIKFIHYRQTDGLANDVVKRILSDDKGNLWISTAYGLSMFNPNDNSFLNFYTSDGLQTVKFGGVAYKNSKTGMLYFGGVGGLISFIPSNIILNENEPKIVITSFKRYNVKDNKMSEEKGISEKKKIALSYQDNILSFEFAALDFYNTSKNKYAYKLEGYNNNWIQMGNKRDVTFTNLDPGEYTLYVRGSNNDGIWNNNGTSLEIIITPPWWKTTWALAGYGIIFVLGVFIVDRIQRRRVVTQERNRAKFREAELIKKQAEELETVDRLVRVINMADNLETVFDSLLVQTISFIPHAEKAALFLLDHNDNQFHIAYTSGYKVDELKKITFSPEELEKRYTENSNEVEKGIYVVSNTSNLIGDEKLSGFKKPKSMLVMAVEWENNLEAYVVFDSFAEKDAFDPSTARILNKFRQHAVSAISKARSIKILQEKNEEIIRAQEQLVTQEKLASLGQLTAGIAHEIKNPLNFVNNFAEVSVELMEELRENLEKQNDQFDNTNWMNIKEILETLQDNTSRINEHGQRADSIVRSMLLHSRKQTGETQTIDINALLEEEINLAYHSMRAQNSGFNITITKDFDKSIGKIRAVPQDISRVFLNIISNGFYETHKKKIENSDEFSPELVVSSKNLYNNIEIRIRDNGSGIPEEIQDKLFEPFFTTKPSGQGTGLGLSLSYDIVVKEHNGDLRFKTEDGEFTEFIISLPKN